MFATLLGGAACFSPQLALAVENPCGSDAKLELADDDPISEFRLTREGAVSRRTVRGARGTLAVEGKAGDTYWVRVERVHHASREVAKERWCTEVMANEVLRLPVSAVPTPDFFRVSVFGTYDNGRDGPAANLMRKREQDDKRREAVREDWTRHALWQFTEEYSLDSLVDNAGALTANGAALQAAIVRAFQPAGATPNCHTGSKAPTEIQGICKALWRINTELLSTGLPAEQVGRNRQKFIQEAPSPDTRQAFCTAAYALNAIERTGSLDYVLLSANELPASDAKETYDLVLGGPKRVFNSAAVGVAVVTWVQDVPVESAHEVTWKADAAVRVSTLEPIVQIIGVVLKSMLKADLGPAVSLFNAKVLSRGFSAAAPVPIPAAPTPLSLLEEFGLDGYCGGFAAEVKLPVLASKGSRVHVAEPLLGYEAYRLTACAGGGCAEGKSSKETTALAEVHTRAEGWRMTLSLGFNAHARGGGRSFESWRWRPVGSTTGSEQLYQYSRANDPLAHASASLLLTFLSPQYLGPGQLGIAVGPSLLVGTELQPLRQWTAHGVWALKRGFHLTVGGGVRFEDVPTQLTREGELQLVSRSSSGMPPDLDQRRVAAAVFNVGFALDLGFVADGGEALLKELGVMR
ncbi:hypothetical protein [Corallococcus exiguus]|uniref:hypothetical protein n=1 Tax=Corallococcus exiguus TaxID=83462 RepID=UPI0014941CBC|nr:hypothetical protein [Corallococcus exiguus]